MGGLHGGGGSVGLERHEPLNRLSSTSYAGVTNRNEVLHEMFKFRLKFEQGNRTDGGIELQPEQKNRKKTEYHV